MFWLNCFLPIQWLPRHKSFWGSSAIHRRGGHLDVPLQSPSPKDAKAEHTSLSLQGSLHWCGQLPKWPALGAKLLVQLLAASRILQYLPTAKSWCWHAVHGKLHHSHCEVRDLHICTHDCKKWQYLWKPCEEEVDKLCLELKYFVNKKWVRLDFTSILFTCNFQISLMLP